jgi:hypothetical protein
MCPRRAQASASTAVAIAAPSHAVPPMAACAPRVQCSVAQWQLVTCLSSRVFSTWVSVAVTKTDPSGFGATFPSGTSTRNHLAQVARGHVFESLSRRIGARLPTASSSSSEAQEVSMVLPERFSFSIRPDVPSAPLRASGPLHEAQEVSTAHSPEHF